MNLFRERLRAINRRPGRADLRRFAFTLAAGFPSSAALWFVVVRIATGRWNIWVPAWIVGIGCPVSLLLALQPGLARPVYVVWYTLVALIDFVVSTVLLTAAFYLVMTPLGLIMRLLGRRPLPRDFRTGAATFWRPAERISDPRRYFRQF